MSDYTLYSKGSLKLRSVDGVKEGGVTKKKKKSSKSKLKEKAEKARKSDEAEAEELDLEEMKPQPSGSAGDAPQAESDDSRRKTDAEKRFEAVQRKRLAQKVEKMSRLTHKDRVNEFNAKLEALSEHHDIPKVGPG